MTQDLTNFRLRLKLLLPPRLLLTMTSVCFAGAYAYDGGVSAAYISSFQRFTQTMRLPQPKLRGIQTKHGGVNRGGGNYSAILTLLPDITSIGKYALLAFLRVLLWDRGLPTKISPAKECSANGGGPWHTAQLPRAVAPLWTMYAPSHPQRCRSRRAWQRWRRAWLPSWLQPERVTWVSVRCAECVPRGTMRLGDDRHLLPLASACMPVHSARLD